MRSPAVVRDDSPLRVEDPRSRALMRRAICGASSLRGGWVKWNRAFGHWSAARDVDGLRGLGGTGGSGVRVMVAERSGWVRVASLWGTGVSPVSRVGDMGMHGRGAERLGPRS